MEIGYKKYLKIILIAFVCIVETIPVNAEGRGKVNLIGGYGYYEALFLGSEYLGQKGNSWGIGMGYNFNFDNLLYNSLFLSYRHFLPLRNINIVDMGFAAKAIYWRQSDEFLIWNNLGIMPNYFMKYSPFEKISFGANIGPQFNFNISNVRHNYLKTGWVKKIDINFSISVAYEL